MAVEEQDRRLEELRQRRDGRVDDLPRQEALPVAGDDVDHVADVIGVVVPVVDREVVELVDQDRRPPLGEEQDREARREDRIVLDQGACQNPSSRSCSCTSCSAPRRYQSWDPKNRIPARRPARSSP